MSSHFVRYLANPFLIFFSLQFTVTEGTRFSVPNQHLFHHLDQLPILQDLFNDMRMELPVIFSIREAAFPAHSSPPFPDFQTADTNGSIDESRLPIISQPMIAYDQPRS